MNDTNTPTRIELSIAPDYVPDWGVWEGLRELIQNARDLGVVNKTEWRVDHDEKAETLRIFTASIMDPKMLLLGHTTKANDNRTIGKFGEGLKLALLCLVRMGHEISIRTGSHRWTPVFTESAAFGSPVLAIDVVDGMERRAETTIEIRGIHAQAWADLRWRFLFLEEPEENEIVRCVSGSVLQAEKMKGCVFVKGIFVTRLQGYDRGYDLQNAPIDRDRRMISGWDLKWNLGQLWRQALTKEPDLSTEFALMLEKGKPDVEGVEFQAPPVQVVERMAKDFAAKYGERAIPVGNLSEATDLAHVGRKGVIVPGLVLKVLRPSFGSIEEIQKTHALTCVDLVQFGDLTEKQSENLLLVVGLIAKEIPDAMDRVFLVRYPKGKDFMGRYVLGGSNPDGWKVEIDVGVLDSLPKTLLTLVHEFAHRNGFDGTIGHDHAIEKLYTAIICRLLKGGQE